MDQVLHQKNINLFNYVRKYLLLRDTHCISEIK